MPRPSARSRRLRGLRAARPPAKPHPEGGNISIDPRSVILDGSRIVADAFAGAGGNITVQADSLIRSPDSIVRASSRLGLPGTVAISAPDEDVSREACGGVR